MTPALDITTATPAIVYTIALFSDAHADIRFHRGSDEVFGVKEDVSSDVLAGGNGSSTVDMLASFQQTSLKHRIIVKLPYTVKRTDSSEAIDTISS